MKQPVKYLIVILAICILFIALSACNRTTHEDEPDHVSYMQQLFYKGGNRDFTVRLIGGTSEAMFVADGVTQNVAPFVDLTVIPQHVDLFNESYTYTLVGTDGEVSGALTKDSFGAAYTARPDIGGIGTPTSVKLLYDEKESVFDLHDMFADAIKGEKAMQLAEHNLADKLSASDKEREIYVKYINDADSDQSTYYWYVAFIASPTDYYAVLVDNDGEIVSVNP